MCLFCLSLALCEVVDNVTFRIEPDCIHNEDSHMQGLSHWLSFLVFPPATSLLVLIASSHARLL